MVTQQSARVSQLTVAFRLIDQPVNHISSRTHTERRQRRSHSHQARTLHQKDDQKARARRTYVDTDRAQRLVLLRDRRWKIDFEELNAVGCEAMGATENKKKARTRMLRLIALV